MNFLYLLYYRRRVKIGIGSNLARRVAQVDKTTTGKQRLVLAVDLPWKARQVEAWLHRRYKVYHAPLKRGSGRTEYFWIGLWCIEAIVIMLAVQTAQWSLIWAIIGLALWVGLFFNF